MMDTKRSMWGDIYQNAEPEDDGTCRWTARVGESFEGETRELERRENYLTAYAAEGGMEAMRRKHFPELYHPPAMEGSLCETCDVVDDLDANDAVVEINMCEDCFERLVPPADMPQQEQNDD